jgi:hypothetical protein
VYRAAGLQVRRRRRTRLTRAERLPMPAATQPRERWSMDFMLDTLADGRVFRTLNIVDDCTRECVAIEGGRVNRLISHLSRVAVFRVGSGLYSIPAALVIVGAVLLIAGRCDVRDAEQRKPKSSTVER